VVPGYEFSRQEADAYQAASEKRASKNRYRATQEKNQKLAKKDATKKDHKSNKVARTKSKYDNKIKKKR
jgi:hypothetical protein